MPPPPSRADHTEAESPARDPTVSGLMSNFPGMAYRLRHAAPAAVEYVSPGALLLTGFPAKAFIDGQVNYADLIHPEDRERVLGGMREANEARRRFEITYRLRRADGDVRWVTDRGQGVWRETGELLRVEGFILDVTEHKRSEDALRRSEHLHSLIFNLSRDLMLLCRVESDGRFVITAVNQAYVVAVRRLGFEATAQDMVGRSLQEFHEMIGLPLDVRKLIIERCQHVAETEESLRYDEVVDTPSRYFYGESSLIPVRDDSGELLYLLYSSRDVSETKQAEAAVRESEERFSRAFAASPGAMGVFDVEKGVFLEVNEGCLKIFGYTREEMIGRSVFELELWGSSEDRGRFLNTLEREGTVREMEVQARRRDGSPRILLLSADPIEVSGRRCIVAAVYDVTAAREAERTNKRLELQLRHAQKLEALGTLAGGIAHDFNNILAAVLAHAELAGMEPNLSHDVMNHLLHVRQAGLRARDLVGQILAFSRQQKTERKPVYLHSVLHEAFKLLRSTLPTMIEMDESFDAAAPPVLADATQLHQVVMNLGMNAAQAMQGRPGRLVLGLDSIQLDAPPQDTIGTELKPGRHVRISVSDTGRGMDEEVQRRIFEPFFTTKGPGEGSGLGLAVVHGIVREHEGAIAVRSRSGEGTTFQVLLRAIDEKRVERKPDVRAMPRGAGERVLLIDDEEMLCRASRGLLERLGYTVTVFSDPRAALAAFVAAPDQFDLVLTDLTMPQMGGLELAREIFLRRADTPLILMSGFGPNLGGEDVRRLGIHAFLPKPVTAMELATAIRSALAARPAGA